MEQRPRLQQLYRDKVIPDMMRELGLKNPMQVPRLEYIALNMGLGEAVQNPKLIDAAREELANIAGQRPVITRAKKSIASFKLREGLPIGVKVTLRKSRKWEFLERFVYLALPRVRDFKGVSPKAFDGRGNYTIGIREQIVFPEIDYDKVEKIKGLNVTFVTSAPNDELGRQLLRHLGMPFRN